MGSSRTTTSPPAELEASRRRRSAAPIRLSCAACVCRIGCFPAIRSNEEGNPKPVIASHTAEGKRLAETYHNALPWRRWGPYVSERLWGTVREDDSDNGAA